MLAQRHRQPKNDISNSEIANSGTFTQVELNALLAIRSGIKTFYPGQAVLDQGERPTDILLVLEGWIMGQKMLEDGSRQILDLALPGSILGFHMCEHAPHGAEAKTECRV
jgi:CRP-like cAMP-binding protein